MKGKIKKSTAIALGAAVAAVGLASQASAQSAPTNGCSQLGHRQRRRELD